MAVPYTFGTATSSIPLSQLDSNFNTVITLGNTAIQLGNTVTTLNNMTLANVTISSGNVTITNVSITTANVTTANITTAVIGTETVTTSTITTANVTTANITTDNITNGTVITSLTLSYGTANGVAYLNGSKVLTTGSALTWNGSTFFANGTIQQGNGGAATIGKIWNDSGLYSVQADYTNVNGLKLDSPAYTVFTLNNAEQMRLTSTGLGIGTSSPAVQIDANKGGSAYAGNLYLTGKFTNGTAALKGIGLGYDNTSQTGIVYAYTGSAASNLAFYTYPGSGSATEAMRIDSSGNLLVGTTTVSASSIANFYKTATAPNQRVLYLTNNGVAGTNSPAGMIITYPNASSGNGSTFIELSDSNTTRFLVLGSGNAQNANNSYGAISDIKLKENIVDATPKLANLMQVKVRNYNLKSDPSNKQIGVIAQELEEVFPALIDETPDTDAEGNDLGTTTKAVKYSVFVPMLIKAIQEQQALIESLTARITALEST